MMSRVDSVMDIIDNLEREHNKTGYEPADVLIMDTYSYALLREELGLDFDADLNRYRGYKIKIDPDSDDIIRLV